MQDLQKRYATVQPFTTDLHEESLVTLAHSVHKGLGVVATIQQRADTSQAVKKQSNLVFNGRGLVPSDTIWTPHHSVINGVLVQNLIT